MIVIDHQPNRVNVAVFGEFTLADYKEFEEVVNYKVRFEGPVDLFFDLSQMAALTLDVAWEEIKFSRAHADDFNRVAHFDKNICNSGFIDTNIRRLNLHDQCSSL